jgi:hypothetical protein
MLLASLRPSRRQQSGTTSQVPTRLPRAKESARRRGAHHRRGSAPPAAHATAASKTSSREAETSFSLLPFSHWVLSLPGASAPQLAALRALLVGGSGDPCRGPLGVCPLQLLPSRSLLPMSLPASVPPDADLSVPSIIPTSLFPFNLKDRRSVGGHSRRKAGRSGTHATWHRVADLSYRNMAGRDRSSRTRTMI